MERRRINLDSDQLNLPLQAVATQPRKHVPDLRDLRAGPHVAALTKEAAPGTVAAPSTRERLAGIPPGWTRAGWGQHWESLTEWSRGRPESSGYWEAKQHSAVAADQVNWWFAAPAGLWFRGEPQRDSRLARAVPHAQFVQSHEWRGFKRPWGDYPYVLERLPFGTPVLLGDAVQVVEVAGKLEVGQPGVSPIDLNPNARKKVALCAE